MALRDFWISVRTAAGYLAPQVIADSPQLDASTIERTLRGTTLWLTPRAVDGFDPADLGFLPADDQKRLTDLVERFGDVAAKVNPKLPASDKAVKEAVPLFRDIVQMLAFDRYGDFEAFQLGKQVEQELGADRPDELAELRFKTGFDHTGDAALWIWAFVKDNAASTDEEFLAIAQMLRPVLERAARKVVPERWPYVSFRSVGEQAELVEQS